MLGIDKDIIDLVQAVLLGVGGWVLNSLRDSQKRRDDFEQEISDRVQAMQLLIAGDYVKKDEFRALSDAIFRKLDKIEDKIDGKADKH